MAPVHVPTLEKPAFIVSIIISLKLVQIVFTDILYGRYKNLPSFNNIFKCMSFFLCFISLHTFLWACRSCVNPGSFSLLCIHLSVISWWISAKLDSALPLCYCMLYLSYCFQPKEHTWMCVWKVITLQVYFCHNLDPRQIICINFEILSVQLLMYHSVVKVKKSVGLNFLKLSKVASAYMVL